MTALGSKRTPDASNVSFLGCGSKVNEAIYVIDRRANQHAWELGGHWVKKWPMPYSSYDIHIEPAGKLARVRFFSVPCLAKADPSVKRSNNIWTQETVTCQLKILWQQWKLLLNQTFPDAFFNESNMD